jgi:hypothetical protein
MVFLVVTQRIAGPIYRIKLTVKSWRDGSGIPLRLRKGDFFQDVADDLQKLRDVSKIEGYQAQSADETNKAS